MKKKITHANEMFDVVKVVADGDDARKAPQSFVLAVVTEF